MKALLQLEPIEVSHSIGRPREAKIRDRRAEHGSLLNNSCNYNVELHFAENVKLHESILEAGDMQANSFIQISINDRNTFKTTWSSSF